MIMEKNFPRVKRVSLKDLQKLKSEGYVVFSSHNHTNFSDGANYRDVIDTLVKNGANLIALTDHNNMRVAKYAESYIKDKYPECQYLNGEEIDSEFGDILAYGLQKEILLEGREKLPIKKIIDNIHNQGGLAVIAHPFHPIEGIFRTFGGLNKSEIINFEFDGIEFFHADLPPFLNNMCASLLKLKPQLFILGADDAHSIHHIGRYLTLIGPNISDVHNIDEIFKALKQNSTNVLELRSLVSRSFEMLPGFMDIIINQGLKRINAFAGIYGLFKGIHFQQESMGWNPITFSEFEGYLQQIMQTMNINTIRLDAMQPDTKAYEFALSAKELGLNVMLSPKYVYPEGIDKPQLDSSLTYDEFEDFCLDHAQRAQSTGVDIFCIGNELTLELSDDKSGHVERFNKEFFERFAPSSLEMIPGLGSSTLAKLSKIGKKKLKLTKYLEKLSKKVRGYFDGMISYASGSWEIRDVPWKFFDVICSNLYFSDLFLEFVEVLPGIKIKIPKGSHSVRASHLFRQNIQYLKTFKKPIILSELGFQTVTDPIRVGPMPIKYHKDYNQFKYDETAQSQAFSEVFKLLTKDIFVNGVIIHEWNDHTDTGFGIVRSDGTPKKAYETIANFFKEWAISGSIEEDDSISQK
jgi:predicted metal-dependent phosphoesterase TrpH